MTQIHDYMTALVAIVRWNGGHIDDLAEAITAARDHGDVEGPMYEETVEGDLQYAVAQMQAWLPQGVVESWPDVPDLVAEDATGRTLTWSDLQVGYGYAA